MTLKGQFLHSKGIEQSGPLLRETAVLLRHTEPSQVGEDIRLSHRRGSSITSFGAINPEDLNPKPSPTHVYLTANGSAVEHCFFAVKHQHLADKHQHVVDEHQQFADEHQQFLDKHQNKAPTNSGQAPNKAPTIHGSAPTIRGQAPTIRVKTTP